MDNSPTPFDSMLQQMGGQTAQQPTPQSTPAPSTQPDSGLDPFETLLAQHLQSKQQNTQAAPTGVSGFVQGLYQNTLKPVVDLASQAKADISHMTSPQGEAETQQLSQQQDAYKQQKYAEAGDRLKSGDILGAAGSLLSLVGGPDKSDVVTNLVSNLLDAHKAEAQKTVAAYKAGNYSEALGHGLATALPIVGPAAAKAGEDIGRGDTSYGLGEATGLIGSVTAPPLIKDAALKALTPETVSLGGEEIPAQPAANKLVGSDAQEAFDRAEVNPVARQAISNVVSDAANSGDAATPSVNDPLGLREASQAPKARAQSGWNTVDDLTNGEFSDAQQQAIDAADDFTAAGKKQYREANARVEALIDQHADALPDGTDAQSLKSDYRQYIGMQKLARSFDTAFETTPGVSDDTGYVNADKLREKIADMRQQGVFKQAGFSNNHVSTLDQIAVRMQNASDYARISRVAAGVAADVGLHTLGLKATAGLGIGIAASRWLIGRAITSPAVAGTLLRGLKSGYAPAVTAAGVVRAMSLQPAPSVPTLQTALE